MAKKVASVLGKTPGALAGLKKKIGSMEVGKGLKGAKEVLAKTARKTWQEILRLKDKFLNNAEDRKIALGIAASGFLAWFLKPAEKEGGKKKDAEPEKGEVLAEILPKKPDGSKGELAEISPKATHEQILAAIQTNAKTLDEMYQKYKKTKDPTELRYFLTRAIIAKESGHRTPVKVAARLINVRAISPNKRRGLRDKYGIDFRMPASSRSLLPSEKYLTNFETFKNRVCNQLQPDVSGAKQINNTAEILIRCAVGMGQILPIYWLPGMKKSKGIDRLKKIYAFIKSGRGQINATVKLVDRLGGRYDWNPMYISAAYYAGAGVGDLMKKNAKHASLSKKAPYGYGSPNQYVLGVEKHVARIIKDEKRAS